MKTFRMAKERGQEEETQEQYQERIVVGCLQELFLRTQIPCSITDEVEGFVRRHGVWGAMATAQLVVEAFEAGKRWGSERGKQGLPPIAAW